MRYKLLTLFILSILLITTVSAFEFDNVKSYDEDTKIVTFKNSLLKLLPLDKIAEVELNTGLIQIVPIGTNIKVAEFEITNYEEYNNILESISFYNYNTGYKKETKDFVLKYKNIETITKTKYKQICSDKINSNGTTYKDCIGISDGTYTKEIFTWENLSKDFGLGIETKIVGIFTDVNSGDKFEWIPNMYGLHVEEWAIFQASDWTNRTVETNSGVITSESFEINANNEFDNKMNTHGSGSSPGRWKMYMTSMNSTQSISYITTNLSMSAVGIGGDLGNGALSAFLSICNSTVICNNYTLIKQIANPGPCGSRNDQVYIDQINTTAITIPGSDSNWYAEVNFDFANGCIETDRNVQYVANLTEIYISDSGGGFIADISETGTSATMNTPADNYSSVSQTVNFNCSGDVVGGAATLQNISLWTNQSGTFELQNITTGLSGTTNESIFNHNLELDGNFLWGCEACSSNGICGTDTLNRTLTIDSTSPTISFTSPSSAIGYHNFEDNLSLNWTVTETNKDSCWFDYNSVNTTVNCVAGNYSFALISGIKSIIFYANDTSNNLGSNSTSWTYKLLFINESYTSSTTAGSTTTFTSNFRTNGTRIGTIYLNYNNTNSITTTSSSGNNYAATISQLAPGVETLTNISFFWNVTMEDSTSYSTDKNNQTVSSIGINDTCSSGMEVIYNLTIVDEITQQSINGASFNGSIKVDFNLYTSDRGTSLKHYHTEKTNINNLAICIDNNLSGGEQYSMDLQIQYGATNYSTEFYNFERETLSQSTLYQNITLYDLDDNNAQEFKLNVRDKSYVPIGNALVKIERKYIENGTFYVTEIPRTDSLGVAPASLQVNDVIYNFYIYSNGILISSFTNVLAVCQNPTLRECQIDFNSYLEGLTIPDYVTSDDFDFTLDYNKTSRIITSQFTIPSGTPSTVKLEVIKEDTLGTAICSDTLTSISGTLSCSVPTQFGNATIRARLYKDDIVESFGTFKLDQSAKDIYGVILVFISVLVMMTLIGVGISDNPVVTGVFIFIGLILVLSMNLVQNTGFYGATASILFFATAMILVIIKAARRS